VRGRSPRPVALFLVGTLAVIAVVAVIGSRTNRTFQSDVARSLAARSDAVAASLARGDRCSANRYAKQLRTAAVAVVRRDLVSPELAPELLTRTARLNRAITCPPPVSPAPAPATPPTPPNAHPIEPAAIDKSEKGKGDHARGDEGRGKKRVHEKGGGESG
jgi:hypothetical protein